MSRNRVYNALIAELQCWELLIRDVLVFAGIRGLTLALEYAQKAGH